MFLLVFRRSHRNETDTFGPDIVGSALEGHVGSDGVQAEILRQIVHLSHYLHVGEGQSRHVGCQELVLRCSNCPEESVVLGSDAGVPEVMLPVLVGGLRHTLDPEMLAGGDAEIPGMMLPVPVGALRLRRSSILTP